MSLVTGGVRGLGLAVARRLRARGDVVHIMYRASRELAAQIEPEFPGRVHSSDAGSADEWGALVARIAQRDGGVDHWVHAVGEYVHGELAGATAVELRRMFASNVDTAFEGLRALRPTLRARGGDAVFFGCAGLDGHHARRTTAIYTAAKSALLVLARSWAVEEARHGVRVNVVSPGHVPHEHASDDTRDAALWQRIPMGRPGTPDEVAHAVEWLTSPAASYVTGANLDISGGWLA